LVCMVPFIALDVLYGTFRSLGFVLGLALFIILWFYKRDEWSLCSY